MKTNFNFWSENENTFFRTMDFLGSELVKIEIFMMRDPNWTKSKSKKIPLEKSMINMNILISKKWFNNIFSLK